MYVNILYSVHTYHYKLKDEMSGLMLFFLIFSNQWIFCITWLSEEKGKVQKYNKIKPYWTVLQ